MDSIPIIALTGQVPTTGIGKDSFQEADITGITMPVVKHSYLLLEATQVPKTIRKAFLISSTGRPGPVLIDLPKDVLNSVLKKYQKIIESEITYFVKNAPRLAEQHKQIDLLFYFIQPKHAIKSPLSTILSFKYPNKTVLIISKDDGRINVSARRHDKKIAVNNLLEESIIGFDDANAGGHAVSAGAAFPAIYFSEFKKRIILQLAKLCTRK
jgi:hypothetical protein